MSESPERIEELARTTTPAIYSEWLDQLKNDKIRIRDLNQQIVQHSAAEAEHAHQLIDLIEKEKTILKLQDEKLQLRKELEETKKSSATACSTLQEMSEKACNELQTAYARELKALQDAYDHAKSKAESLQEKLQTLARVNDLTARQIDDDTIAHHGHRTATYDKAEKEERQQLEEELSQFADNTRKGFERRLARRREMFYPDEDPLREKHRKRFEQARKTQNDDNERGPESMQPKQTDRQRDRLASPAQPARSPTSLASSATTTTRASTLPVMPSNTHTVRDNDTIEVQLRRDSNAEPCRDQRRYSQVPNHNHLKRACEYSPPPSHTDNTTKRARIPIQTPTSSNADNKKLSAVPTEMYRDPRRQTDSGASARGTRASTTTTTGPRNQPFQVAHSFTQWIPPFEPTQ